MSCMSVSANSPMKMLKCRTWQCEKSAWGICLLKQQYYHESHSLGLNFQISWKSFGLQSCFIYLYIKNYCSKTFYLSRRDSVIPGMKPASDQSMPSCKGPWERKEGLRSGNPQKPYCIALCVQSISYSLEHCTTLNQLSSKVISRKP